MKRNYAQRKAALKNAQRHAVAKLRPKKADRESYIFLTPKGKRVKPTSREKVFAVYVTRNGKKRIVKPKDTGGLASLKPHRVSSIQPTDSLPRKHAAAKYLAEFKAQRPEAPADILTVKPPQGKRVLDFDAASRKFAQHLSDLVSDIDPRSKRQFIVEVSATLRLPDGTLRTLTTIPFEFGAAFLIQYRRKDLLGFARNKIYALLGNEFDAAGLITTGSMAFIRRRSYNRGADPQDWRQKMPKGELVLWRYAAQFDEYQHAQLVQLDYRVTQQ